MTGEKFEMRGLRRLQGLGPVALGPMSGGGAGLEWWGWGECCPSRSQACEVL